MSLAMSNSTVPRSLKWKGIAPGRVQQVANGLSCRKPFAGLIVGGGSVETYADRCNCHDEWIGSVLRFSRWKVQEFDRWAFVRELDKRKAETDARHRPNAPSAGKPKQTS